MKIDLLNSIAHTHQMKSWKCLPRGEFEQPVGPLGCLGDVDRFNFFGRVYVEFIGRARLASAGWAGVDEVGDGFACYSTEAIDDPNWRTHKNRIIASLAEFYWTPGCSRARVIRPLISPRKWELCR